MRPVKHAPLAEEPYAHAGSLQVVNHVAVTYPDLDPVLAHLKATGVPILEGPYPFGETRAVLIEDLDGLALELIEAGAD